MSSTEPSTEVRCGSALSSILANRQLMDKLAQIFFETVYDKDEKRCRNLSLIDRLATSISRYSAKMALYDVKRGMLVGGREVGVEQKVVEALNTIEICLDVAETKALGVLKTIALNTLSRCLAKQG